MRRTVDMLVYQHPLIARAASIALILLGLGILAVMAVEAIPGVSKGGDTLVGCLLGATLIASLAAMIGATYQVIRKRRLVDDWGIFLVITWLLPYIGIAAYLGGVGIRQCFRSDGRG